MISVRWVLLFAFTGWCSANALAQSKGAPKPSPSANPANLDCTDEKNFSRCFKLVSTAHGRNFTQNTYTGPDGETVYTAEVSFDSREKAVKAFDELEKSAATTVDTAKLVGKDEREERLDVLRLEGEPFHGAWMAIQTSDDKLLTVQSKSSKDVEIMANQMKEHATKP
jgi:hypothetical protein